MRGGRPRQFRNGAEKQRAYRERRRAIIALLNSPLSAPSSEAKALLDAASLAYDEYQKQFWQVCVIEDRYPDWSREMNRLYEVWCELHHRWWEEQRHG